MSHDPRIPRATALVVRNRADNCCEDCGESDHPCAPLELHHLRYFTQAGYRGGGDPGGEPIHRLETVEDLDLLCRHCHNSRHYDYNGTPERPKGQYWRDPEEMADAWFGYRHAIDKDD